MLPSLLVVAFGLILVGFVLVLLGSSMSGSGAGCFFWPLPVVVVCGAGSGGAPYTFAILGAVIFAVVLLLSSFWMRKAPSSADSHAGPSES